MKYALMIAAAAAAATLGGASAQACMAYNPSGKTSGKEIMPAKLPPAMLEHRDLGPNAARTIVGLWHVVHNTTDDHLYFESFDTWHADGTEIELANIPPAAGPICVGVWSQENQTITLYHTTWFYDPTGAFTGTMEFRATNKVAKDGKTFDGRFKETDYDPNGNVTKQTNGTTHGDRIVSTQ